MVRSAGGGRGGGGIL